MRHLHLLRAIVMTVNLTIAGAGALAVYSILFAFSVDLPGQEDVQWYIEGDDIILMARGAVENNGFYDVDDVTVDATAWRSSGVALVSSHLHYPTLPRGTTALDIVLRFNLTQLREYTDMLFQDESITVRVEVSAEYLYSLVGFHAEYSYDDAWEALIKSFWVDQGNITSHYWDGHLTLEIPYGLRCSDILSGVDAGAEVRMYAAGETIARNSTTLTLHPEVTGIFELSIDRNWTLDLLTHSRTVTFRIMGFFSGQTGYLDLPYWWGAPFDGLDTSTNINASGLTILYSYTDNASHPLEVSTSLNAYDANGTLLESSRDQYRVAVGEHISRSMGISFQAYTSAERVVFTLMDTATGARYMEVIEK